jgi:ribonuclease E
MSKEIYISSTPHETRLAIVEDEALTEIYYERENEYTLAGSIYNGRVTRVLPGMQSSFVDIGLERDAFLYITDFLEEAPDSEEFDTTPHGDRPPRTIEGEASPARTDAGPRAGERNDRGDRGGRGRRGGRDRDRNGDRPASDRDRSDAPRIAAPPADAANIPVPPSAELGEGAPGADGNRRWRGRRGRRRGRGVPGQPGDPAQENAASVNSDDSGYSADQAPFDSDSYREIDGAAEETLAAAPAPEYRSDRPSDRGRRNEGRGGQRREGQRSDAPRREQTREQRAPRGFAPTRDLYGVGTDEPRSTAPIADAYDDFAPAGEPIILPGESLSKYRNADQPAAASSSSATPPTHATTVTLAPPANLYTLAEGWDGGATLPGETLSRRRPADSGGESRRPQRDFDREPRRGNGSGREGRADTRRDERTSFRNAPGGQQQFIGTGEPSQNEGRGEIIENKEPLNIQQISASEAAASAIPAASPAAFADLPEASLPHEASAVAQPEPEPLHEVEYEPSDASASYRVDPVAPSEFRQSAPVLDAPTEVADAPAEFEEPVHTSTHSITPAPGEHAARLHSEAQASAAEAHDITSIAPSGEMYSEPVETVQPVEHLPPPIETPQAASPIHHEGAVVDSQRPVQFSDATGDFATGSGQLDEETMEDEFEGTTLQASSIEEMDDLEEEETLEGAADLGTMLREMSIDHITSKSPIEDESDVDDDLDEDDLDEEDLDHDDEDDDEQDADQGYQMEEQSSASEYDPHEHAARAGTAEDAEFFEQQFGQNAAGEESDSANQPASGTEPGRSSGRDSARRGGRRERDGRRGRSDRERSADRSPDRTRRTGGHSNGHGRHSMQTTNLPAISDLLKPGQEILVQIAKEPIAKKGARITSHIALPGRFLVFMPTVNHTGVSRKIESDGERRRLKEILLSEKGEATGGFIVRTAAEGASEEELRSDLRFLLNLWADIKNRSESSKSPALIYHDLNLIERILRDQVTDNFSAIWVDTEAEYERVLRFLQRFQPSLIRRVKLYLKETPLFEQFGITEEINKALRSKVWLKSGGSIVINQTEALVAIDINTGKFVGKTARLEDTIVKTNLDAIPEIVRQIRLRDLGGIIIIDFIDMDERKNRNRVMAALEDELKNDRAPSKVLQFNDFGLVAITRKRVKQSLERTLSTPCNVCTGTGMVKSPITVCNDIYIEMRKMHKHLDRGDVMLRVHPDVVKQLKTSGAKWLQEMEEMCGKTILVKSDPSLHPEQFDIH